MISRTDPPKVDIYLVNQNAYPNTQEVVATGVDTSLGRYVIKAKDIDGVDTGYVNLAVQENKLSKTDSTIQWRLPSQLCVHNRWWHSGSVAAVQSDSIQGF